MKYAQVKFKKSGVTIRTVVTKREQNELRTKSTLDGITVERFRFEGKNSQPKNLAVKLTPEQGCLMKALRQYYSTDLWVKVFRRMLLDTVISIGTQPKPKNMTPVQKEGFLYLQKASLEIKKEMKRKHGKRISRRYRRNTSR